TTASCSCQSMDLVDPEYPRSPVLSHVRGTPARGAPVLTANVPPLEACGEQQKVAKSLNGTCPGTNGELLSQSGHLANFCVYRNPGNGQKWGPGVGVRSIGECPVHVQEAEIPPTTLRSLSMNFDSGVGYVREPDVFNAMTGKVTIAVIDTFGIDGTDNTN